MPIRPTARETRVGGDAARVVGEDEDQLVGHQDPRDRRLVRCRPVCGELRQVED
jgi:hypothetical protein